MVDDDAILMFACDLSAACLSFVAGTIGARASAVTFEWCEDSLEALWVWLMVSLRMAAFDLSFFSAIFPFLPGVSFSGFTSSSVT